MEGLDIRVIKSKKDLEILSNPGNMARFLDLGKKQYFAIAAIEGEMVGSWTGGMGYRSAPDHIKVEDPYFYSEMIFIRDKVRFGNKGIGTEIKRHQLEFARDKLGCRSLYCEVEHDNRPSLRIQEKLGARIIEDYERCRCVFDLENLNF